MGYSRLTPVESGLRGTVRSRGRDSTVLVDQNEARKDGPSAHTTLGAVLPGNGESIA